MDWPEIATSLRRLHAQLLKHARAQYSREHPEAGELSIGAMLMLATQSEDFAWLRGLSELMAEIDELRDDARFTGDPAVQGAVRAALDELLGTQAQAATPFQVRYWRYVHDDPDVAIAHGRVRQLFQAISPAPSAGRQAMSAYLASLRASGKKRS